MKTRPIFNRSIPITNSFTVAAATMLLAHVAQAANVNGAWTQIAAGDASGTWSNADTANWSAGAVADGSGFTADFSTLDITAVTAASSITLGEPRTIGNLIFGDTDNTTVSRWILAAAGGNGLTLAGTTPTITVNNLGNGSITNSTVTISAVISGGSGLTKDGTGTVASQSTFGKGVLLLSGANDYTGGTTISSGALAAANSSALGTGAVTVASGAQLQVRGVNIANTININGTSALFSTAGSGSNLSGIVNLQSNSNIGLASNSGNATMTLSGTLNLAGNTLTAATINVSPAIIISGVINGSGSIIKNNDGTLRISGDNINVGTYSGTTTLTRGILELGSSGALGSGTFAFSVNNDQAGTIRSSDTTARTIAATVTTPSGPGTGNANSRYVFGSTSASFNGDLTFTNATDIDLGTVVKRLEPYNVTQFNAGFTGTGGILKQGTGTFVLNGVSNYTGPTTINVGTLVVNGSLGATAVSVNANGTLSGTGSIGGSVTAATNGHLAVAIAATPGSQDPLAITGALTLESGNVLDLTAASAPSDGVYTLATAAGGVSYTAGTVNLTGVSGVVSVSGNSLILTVGGGGSANFAGWASANGVTGGVDGDSDNDGISNGVEYGLNLNVTGFDGPPGTHSGNLLTFNKRATTSGNSDLSYRIEVSTDLGVSVPWTEVGAYVQNDSSVISANIPNGPSKNFARLQVVVNP